ncbi:MAG: biotin/lipoyl-containing protein, partial [Kiritimatiellia bacterium]
MADAVIMPKFGQTVEEVTIVRWHKREGDEVRKGDVLFEVETEKAVLEAPSFYDGSLLKILVREGMSVPVSSVVAYIGKKGEKVPEAPQAPVVSAAVAPSSPHGREAPLRKPSP